MRLTVRLGWLNIGISDSAHPLIIFDSGLVMDCRYGGSLSQIGHFWNQEAPQ